MSAQIHVANNSGQVVYVYAAETEAWQITDDISDVAVSLCSLWGSTKIFANIGEALGVFQEIRNWDQLITSFKVFSNMMLGPINLARKVNNLDKKTETLINDLKNGIKKACVTIQPGDVQDVLDTSTWHQILTPSGLAGDVGDVTINLLIVTEDLMSQTTETNDNRSWIVQPEGIIIAEQGKLWVRDPNPVFDLQYFSSGYMPAGNFYQTCKDPKLTLSAQLKNDKGYGVEQTMDITKAQNLNLNNVNGTFQNAGNGQVTGFVPTGSYLKSSSGTKVVLSCQAQSMDGGWNDTSIELTNLDNPYIQNINGQLINKPL